MMLRIYAIGISYQLSMQEQEQTGSPSVKLCRTLCRNEFSVEALLGARAWSIFDLLGSNFQWPVYGVLLMDSQNL